MINLYLLKNYNHKTYIAYFPHKVHKAYPKTLLLLKNDNYKIYIAYLHNMKNQKLINQLILLTYNFQMYESLYKAKYMHL